MNYLLKGILVCLPFLTYVFIGKPILTTQALLSIALEVVIILLFVVGIWNKRTPDLKAPVLFFAYILITSGWFIGKGLFADDRMNIIVRPLLHTSIFFLFYFALCHILNQKTYEDIARVIIYPAVALSAICLFQKFGIDMFKYSVGWVNGTLGNPTNNAMYLSACLPFAFLHKRSFIPVIFLFAGMVVCNSTSALASATIVIFIYLLVKRKFVHSFILILVLFFVAVVYKDNLSDFFNPFEKLLVWQKAIESWRDHYLIGHGIDAFKNLHVVYNNSLYSFTHNHYIWILHSFGLIGLVLFANWMRSLKFNFNDIRFSAVLSVISVGIMACVSVPMRAYCIVILTAFNMAILTKEKT